MKDEVINVAYFFPSLFGLLGVFLALHFRLRHFYHYFVLLIVITTFGRSLFDRL